MSEVSRKQIGCIKTLVSKLGVDGAEMAAGFSQGRTEHVSELRGDEAAAMIRHLKALDPEEAKAEVMRRKIIGLAYQRAGLPRTASAEQKRAVVRWLDEWCTKYGYMHKALNSHTYAELPKLVTQFENVLEDLLISI